MSMLLVVPRCTGCNLDAIVQVVKGLGTSQYNGGCGQEWSRGWLLLKSGNEPQRWLRWDCNVWYVAKSDVSPVLPVQPITVPGVVSGH